MVSEASKKLKEIRKRSGVKIQELSDVLGYKYKSGYQHWEERYKKTFLPLEVVQAIKPLFLSAGIAEADIDALAGVSTAKTLPKPDISAIDDHLRFEAYEMVKEIWQLHHGNEPSRKILQEVTLEVLRHMSLDPEHRLSGSLVMYIIERYAD